MTVTLERAEHHDAEQVTNMEGWTSRVETDVPGHRFAIEQFAQTGFIRDVVDVPTSPQVVDHVLPAFPGEKGSIDTRSGHPEGLISAR